jgi:hypothetical protein
MNKKAILFFISLCLLTSCAAKPAKPTINFNPPTSGPDLSTMKPSYGPNDPVPTPVATAPAPTVEIPKTQNR